MTTASAWMKTSDVRQEVRRTRTGEWTGVSWTDSSWELAHGLEVVEDLPPDVWPPEFERGQLPLATPQKS